MLEEKCAICHINPTIQLLESEALALKGAAQELDTSTSRSISDETDSIIAALKTASERYDINPSGGLFLLL